MNAILSDQRPATSPQCERGNCVRRRLFGWRRQSHFPRSRFGLAERGGFSLLEVILAFAILAGSLAVLGQLISIGMRSAREAEGMTESQMICQTIMDEIIIGVRLPDPVQEIPVDMLTDSSVIVPNRTIDWVYSIDSELAPIDGLLMIRVSVRRLNAISLADADQFQLIRWIPDPDAELLEMPESSDPNSTSSTSGGSI